MHDTQDPPPDTAPAQTKDTTSPAKRGKPAPIGQMEKEDDPELVAYLERWFSTPRAKEEE